MNQSEYAAFINTKYVEMYPRGSDLANKAPRTLIYGYTCDRDTFHVYLDERGVLNRVIYNSDGFLLSHADESTPLAAYEYSPEKRAYPEACDLAFCGLLKQAGVEIPFTTFNESRVLATWYGKRKEDLIAADLNDHLGSVFVTVDELNLPAEARYLPGSQTIELESRVSGMLTEVFDKVYRRIKYLKSDELPGWLGSLPGNVEWSIRSTLESMGYTVPPDYKLSPEVAEALRDKVKAVVLGQLYPKAA